MPHKGHDHIHDDSTSLKMAFFLNLSFTILEIIGGLWTNSLAIISDALHDLGDSLSLGIAWYLENYSRRGPDENFSFGYSRFSLLGALINSLILTGGGIFVLVRAVPRIFSPQQVNAAGMVGFAVLGIIINGLAALRVQKGHSLNEKVVSWHLLEDVLGWAVVLIVSIVLLFKDIPVLDPLLSLIITLYVLYNVIKKLKDVLGVFLQGVPEDYSIKDIEKLIAEETGVKSVHHTHLWSLEGEKNLLSTHIVVKDEISQDKIVKIKQKIRELMDEKGIGHVTIEVDFESERCGNDSDY